VGGVILLGLSALGLVILIVATVILALLIRKTVDCKKIKYDLFFFLTVPVSSNCREKIAAIKLPKLKFRSSALEEPPSHSFKRDAFRDSSSSFTISLRSNASDNASATASLLGSSASDAGNDAGAFSISNSSNVDNTDNASSVDSTLASAFASLVSPSPNNNNAQPNTLREMGIPINDASNPFQTKKGPVERNSYLVF
jgi:hypothetical protein